MLNKKIQESQKLQKEWKKSKKSFKRKKTMNCIITIDWKKAWGYTFNQQNISTQAGHQKKN